jgi:peptidoglycan/LPS O-acetylase OafA/YrhL
MEREFSIALELSRALAAFSVFLAHFSYMGYTSTHTEFFHEYGHAAVVMFFVLSGYVIAYVCENKHADFRSYMTARFARLYSVLLFALLLTYVLDTAGRYLDPSVYSGIEAGYPVASAMVSVLFLQQSSLFSVKYLSNGPLWSLSYEFWYYVIFGCFYYFRGLKRVLSLALLMLVVWPKVLLLFPCWILGVLIYRLHKVRLEKSPAHTGIVVLAFSGFWVIASQDDMIHWLSMLPLQYGLYPSSSGFSSYFLSDYLLAATFGLLLFSLKYAAGLHPLAGKKTGSVVSLFSGFSFSMYSYHVPVILFLASTGLFVTDSAVSSLLLMFVSIVSIYLLSRFTEARVKQLRNLLNRIQLAARTPNLQTLRSGTQNQ